MGILEDFVDILSAENDLLSELVDLSKAKQKKINDAQAVVRYASEEQTILAQLEEADKERIILFDAIAPGQNLEEWLASLDEEQEMVIGPLILRLIENIGELQRLNDLNQELLAQSLNFVEFSLNMLVGDEGSPTYQRPGTNSPGKSIFDRKV